MVAGERALEGGEPEDAQDGQGSLTREVLDCLDMSVVVYDADLRFVTANQGYHALFPHVPDDGSRIGWTFEQMLRNTLDVAPHLTPLAAGQDVDEFVAERTASMRAAAGRRSEVQAASGRWDRLHVATTPSGYRVSTRVNITDQKELEAQLRKALAAEAAASQGKSKLIASLGHELRTPLNAIIGFSEEILANPVDASRADSVADAAATIGEAGRYLLTLIEELLGLARVEAGRLALDRADLPVVEAARPVLRLLRERAIAAGAKLAIGPGAETTRVRADARVLHQMLLNLVGNAVAHAGATMVEVCAEPGPDGGADIVVRDDGQGVPDQVKAELGQGFVTNARGSGLGLALVRAMMREHGGDLLLDDNPGGGARAILRFPA